MRREFLQIAMAVATAVALTAAVQVYSLRAQIADLSARVERLEPAQTDADDVNSLEKQLAEQNSKIEELEQRIGDLEEKRQPP